MADPRKTLEPLTPALAARKDRDAQALAETRRRLDALDAERARIEEELTEALTRVDAEDLPAAAALDRWRLAQQARLRTLAARRGEIEAEEDARHQTLSRSNGELRAAETLAAQAAREARETAEKKRLQRMPTPEPRARLGGGDVSHD